RRGVFADPRIHDALSPRGRASRDRSEDLIMGLSTSEPIPSGMEYGCRFALPASAQDIPQTVVAIATAIAATDTPVAFVDQGHYDVALNGVIWRLVMFWRDGHRVVTAWWCAPRTEYFEPFV